MAKYTALGRDSFAHKYWKAPQDLRFFAENAIIPLGAHEAPQAGLHMPLAFIKQQNTYDLVALTGIRQNESLGVDPMSGQWTLYYVPDLAKVYPFRLTNKKDSDELIVIVDEASGLITNDSNDWPFFQSNGEPEEQLAVVIQRLQQLQQGRMASFELCQRLEDGGLLEPWNIEIKGEDESNRIGGLYRINEKALNELGNVPFLGLRQNGALALAYAQLLSMGNIHKLGRLAYLRQQEMGMGDSKPDYADGFESDVISFS